MMDQRLRDQITREINEILDKYQIEYKFKLEFPIYNQIPEEVKLAMIILEKHGMTLSIHYQDRKKKK